MSDDEDEERCDDDDKARAWRAGWSPGDRCGSAATGRSGRVVTFLDLNNGSTRVVRDPETIKQLQKDPNFAVASQAFQPEHGRHAAALAARLEPDGSSINPWAWDRSARFAASQTSILFPTGQPNLRSLIANAEGGSQCRGQ